MNATCKEPSTAKRKNAASGRGALIEAEDRLEPGTPPIYGTGWATSLLAISLHGLLTWLAPLSPQPPAWNLEQLIAASAIQITLIFPRPCGIVLPII